MYRAHHQKKLIEAQQEYRNMQHSQETKLKISIANSGVNHGMYGKHQTTEAKARISSALKIINKGQGNPMYGVKLSAATKKKMSEAHKKIELPQAFKKGRVPWNKGIEYLALRGVNHPRWNGGITGRGHTAEFRRKRSSIRKRDNYTCQDCGVKQRDLKKALAVHHKDGNKKNDNNSNLISLCGSCHASIHWEWLK